jgi:Stress responsive A/B Barrel Domain
MGIKEWKKNAATGFIGLTALVLALSFIVDACVSPPPPGPNVTHVVLMWLKHPERAEDRAELIRAARSLRMIPGVLRVVTDRALLPIGPRAPQDFDLGVAVTFRDRAALNRYEKDPRQSVAMQRYLHPLVRRYEVYNLGSR